MNARCTAIVTATALLAATACSEKVLMPPRVDLSGYGTIGIVEFSSNSKGNLDTYATQKFLQTVQAAQPGVRALELGSEGQLLRKVDADELDFMAIRKLGEQFGIDALFVGHLEVTSVKPKVNIGRMLTSMSLEANVSADLTTRLFETRSGATVWTRSARGSAPVAAVSLAGNGLPTSFESDDPEKAYGKLVNALVGKVGADFWSYYQKK